MEVLLLWIGLSVLAGVAASSRGRSFLGFFLLALLLSPLIGIIAAFAVARNEEVLAARAVAGGTARKCPQCAEVVKVEARVCKHCGASLPAVSVRR